MPARYTDKIYDILQRENPDADLSTITGIREAAKKSLFTEEMLAFVDEKHRDTFSAGFALHYLQDEIGYPAFSAWQIALLEKMLNNADYINLIYEHLDKQVFSNYRVHKGNASHTDNVVTTPNLTDETTYGSKTTNTQSGKVVVDGTTSGETSSTSNSGKMQTTSDGSNTTDTNGTSTTESTTGGTTHDESTSDSTTANTGTVKTDDSSTDNGTRAEHSTDTTTQDGSKTTTNSGNTVTTEHGAQGGKNWQHFSNTPQNRLSDVENGTYLTNATYQGNEANQYTDTVNNGESTTTETFNGYKSTSEHLAEAEKNKTTNEHTGTSTRTDDTQTTSNMTTSSDGSSSSSSKTDSQDTNKSTSTSNDTSTTEQLTDATASGTSSGTSKTTTDYQDVKNDTDRSGTDSVHHTGETTTERNGSDTADDETYEISMAMLLQAEPLMSKLWRLFDDLFMMVYDTYNYWE